MECHKSRVLGEQVPFPTSKLPVIRHPNLAQCWRRVFKALGIKAFARIGC
jgi:hypothetical protein